MAACLPGSIFHAAGHDLIAHPAAATQAQEESAISITTRPRSPDAPRSDLDAVRTSRSAKR